MFKIAWSPIFAHALPKGHRFPMVKYDLIPEQLLYEGTIKKEQLFEPPPLEEKWILKTHDANYWERLRLLQLSRQEIRKTGFPHSEELIHREIVIMNGTLLGAESALENGVAFNVAGGTHHAFSDRGEGFCLLNDIAIAANYLRETKQVNQILVVDLDVHQGNGTAALFQKNPAVFTFSMHGEKNYPLHKEASDLDVPVPDGTEDEEYLRTLNAHLFALFESVKPDFVFYQCGVDVLATDKLGRLNLSLQGCRERDRIVLTACHENGIPVHASMGGGYSERLANIVEAHANTYRLATQIFS